MTFSRTVGADKLVNQRGFTLIELSIVLAIIGLLVGGVLKGQEMINGARLKTTVAQVDTFRAAVNTFQDKYSALPGDFSTCSTSIANCNAATNGNGDGTISAAAGWGGYWLNSGWGNNEAAKFWQQLALANLIGGITVESALSTAVPGVDTPKANYTSGYFALQDINNVMTAGYYLSVASKTNEGPIVSGKDAYSIDSKYDDGTPGGGSIVSLSGGTCETGATASVAGTYTMADTGASCVLAFSLY
ncbi:MAG TPA: prepilin-type N-terminal cleavage/methylation domain-containing protein [Patescibacteria group bacterium]|nr:prepilin-type N-terminal cleavage/methylation domain-containing protein [Patescibacteria group bacterium]